MKKHKLKRVSGAQNLNAANQVNWKHFILIVLCAGLLAAGFFYAARQHFSTMDLGLKNSKLRKQIEDLETERRRLILAKEMSLSPLEITKAAERMGFQAKLNIPQAETIAETKKAKVNSDPHPVLASALEPKESLAVKAVSDNKADNKTEEKRKLVVPIKQQVPARSSSVNERPRIVAESQPVKYPATTRSTDKTQ